MTRKEKAQAQAVYRQENPDKVRAYTKRYYNANKETVLRKCKIYVKRNKAKILRRMKVYGKRRSVELKFRVVNHYCHGRIRCQCPGCPIRHISLLTADHKDGKGRFHREAGGVRFAGPRLWSWIIRNGYPKGFQILCWSCNSAKGTKCRCPRHGKSH